MESTRKTLIALPVLIVLLFLPKNKLYSQTNCEYQLAACGVDLSPALENATVAIRSGNQTSTGILMANPLDYEYYAANQTKEWDIYILVASHSILLSRQTLIVVFNGEYNLSCLNSNGDYTDPLNIHYNDQGQTALVSEYEIISEGNYTNGPPTDDFTLIKLKIAQGCYPWDLLRRANPTFIGWRNYESFNQWKDDNTYDPLDFFVSFHHSYQKEKLSSTGKFIRSSNGSVAAKITSGNIGPGSSGAGLTNIRFPDCFEFLISGSQYTSGDYCDIVRGPTIYDIINHPLHGIKWHIDPSNLVPPNGFVHSYQPFSGTRNNENLNELTEQLEESRQSCYYEALDKYIFHCSDVINGDIVFDKDVHIESGVTVTFRGDVSIEGSLVVLGDVIVDNTGITRIEDYLLTDNGSSVTINTNTLEVSRLRIGNTTEGALAEFNVTACESVGNIKNTFLGPSSKVDLRVNSDLHLGDFTEMSVEYIFTSKSNYDVSIYSSGVIYLYNDVAIDSGDRKEVLFAADGLNSNPRNISRGVDFVLLLSGGTFKAQVKTAIFRKRYKVILNSIHAGFRGGFSEHFRADGLTFQSYNDYIVTSPRGYNAYGFSTIDFLPFDNLEHRSSRDAYQPRVVRLRASERIEVTELNFYNDNGDYLKIESPTVNIRSGTQGAGSQVTSNGGSLISRTEESENSVVVNRLANTSFRCCEANRNNVNYEGADKYQTLIEKQEVNPDELSIYPNPTDNILHIKWIGDLDLEKVVIHNIYGNKVLEQSVISTNNNLHTLYLENFSNGVYFLNVFDRQNNVIKIHKIILVD